MPIDTKKPIPVFVSKSPHPRLETLVSTNKDFRKLVQTALHSEDDWEEELRSWNHLNPRLAVSPTEFQAHLAHQKEQLGLHTVFSHPTVPQPKQVIPLHKIDTPKKYQEWLEEHYTPQELKRLRVNLRDVYQKNRYALLFAQLSHFVPEESLQELVTSSEKTGNDSELFSQYLYWRNRIPHSLQRLFPDDLFLGFRNWILMRKNTPNEKPLEKTVETKIEESIEKQTEEKAKDLKVEKKTIQAENRTPPPIEQETPLHVREESEELTSSPREEQEEEILITPQAPEMAPSIPEEFTRPIPSQQPVSETAFSSPVDSQPPLPQEERKEASSSRFQDVRQRAKQVKNANDIYKRYQAGERNIGKLLRGEKTAGRTGGRLLQKGARSLGRGIGRTATRALTRFGLLGGGGGSAAVGGGATAVGVGAGAAGATGGAAVTTGVVASAPVWVPILLLILGILLVLFLIIVWIIIIFFHPDDKLATIILQKTANKQQIPNPKDATAPEDTHVTFTISASHDESEGIQIYDDIPDNADFVSATGTYIAYDAAGKRIENPASTPELVRRVVWQFNGDGTIPTTPGIPTGEGTNMPRGWPMNGQLTQGPFGSTHNAYASVSDIRPVDIWASGSPPIYATFNAVVKTAHYCDTDGTCDCYDEPTGRSLCPSGQGYGNYVDLTNESNSFLVRNGHLQRIDVTQGATIKRGTVLGTMGRTGYVTGPHLHWEFRGLELAPPYIPQAIQPPNCDGSNCTPLNVTFDPSLTEEETND